MVAFAPEGRGQKEIKLTSPAISLDEYLAVPLDEELPETQPVLEGDVQASAALRRLALLRGRIASNRYVADNETSKIQEWEREVNAPLERQAQFFEGVLSGYMKHVRDTTQRKSITLPGGTLKTTAKQPKWEVADPEAFIKWARAAKLTDLYAAKYVPATLPNIKKAFVDDGDGNVVNPNGGEIVPGLKITPPEAPYSVTITTESTEDN